MKIAVVCYNLGWQTGGPRLIFSTVQAWQKMGHKVVIYAPEFKTDAYRDLWDGLDIRVISPGKPLLWEYTSYRLWDRMKQKFNQSRLYKKIARLIATGMDTDFDIVNYHDFAYRVAPHYRKRNPNAKAIWTMNDPPFMYLPKENPIYDLLSLFYNWNVDREARKSFRYLDAAVVLVEANRKWMLDHGLTNAKALWCGVDYDQFYRPAKKIEVGKKSVRLLAVGAFNKYRRYDDIVRAATILRREGYDAQVTLICKDIWNAKDDKKELLEITEAEKMMAYVDFRFQGATEEELFEAYRISDIYVLVTHLPPPRNGYSWGLAVIEGMVAGLPAIITNTNDIREALVDKETALFVDPRSPEDIAKKVKLLLEHPGDYERIAKAGQEFIHKHMTWDVYAQGYLDLANIRK